MISANNSKEDEPIEEEDEDEEDNTNELSNNSVTIQEIIVEEVDGEEQNRMERRRSMILDRTNSFQLDRKRPNNIPEPIQTERYNNREIPEEEETPPQIEKHHTLAKQSNLQRKQTSLKVNDKEQSTVDKLKTIAKATLIYTKKNFKEYLLGVTGCLSLSLLVLAALGLVIFSVFGFIPYITVKYAYTECQCTIKNVTIQNAFGFYRPTWIMNVSETAGCVASNLDVTAYRFPYPQDWEYQSFIQAQRDIIQHHQNKTLACLVRYNEQTKEYTKGLVGFDKAFSTGHWFVFGFAACLIFISIVLFVVLLARAVIMDVMKHLDNKQKKDFEAWEHKQNIHVSDILEENHLQKLQNGYEEGDQPSFDDPQP